VIQRPRLLALLQRRFEHRLTVIVAGAGFGKTTLLAHAVAANALEPDGDDCYLSVGAPDRAPEVLLAGLARAVGGPDARHADVGAVADEVWARAPRSVALLLDDTHLLDGSASWSVVADLLEHLPENGHLVVAGRRSPSLPVRRLQARGQAQVLGEDELAFTDDELEEYAAAAGLGRAEGRTLPAWPALAALSGTVGKGATIEFVWDEVLSGLDADRRVALAMVAPLARLDDELVRAALGDGWTAAGLVAGLPLVAGVDGVFRLHDLWQDVLADGCEPGRRAEALVAAGAVHLARGEHVEAARAYHRADRPELVAVVARRFAALPLSAGLNRDDADAIARLLSPADRHGPLGAYFGTFHAWALDHREVQRTMRSIALAATEGGDEELASLAFWRLTQLQGDDDPSNLQVDPVVASLAARGLPLARSAVALVRSHQAEERADVEGALAVLDDFVAPDLATASMARGSRLLALGQPERIAVTLEDVLADGVQDPIAAQAVWFRGEIDPMAAWPIAAGLPAMFGQRRVPAAEVALIGIVAAVGVAAGEVAEARQLADLALAKAGPLPRRSRLFAEVADAMVALAEDGDRACRERFERLFAEVPLAPWPAWAYLSALAPIRALVPGTEWLDDLRLGPSLRTAVAAGRAVAELRAGRGPGAARALPWAMPTLLAVHVPPPLRAELLVALAGELPAAPALLDAVPHAGRWLRRSADHPDHGVRRAAAAAVVRFPHRPPYDLAVRTFGGFTVERTDGRPVVGFDRKARLQQLLGLLLVERSASRAALAARMWPDLAERPAANNFRVTLSTLLDVLEPDRAGEQPWFVRSEGDRVSIASEGVRTDAAALVDAMDRARLAEQQFAPALALEHFAVATARYRGPFLAELDDAAVALERSRLRALAHHAWCRRGELLLARGEPEEALAAATAAVGIDELSERAHRLRIRCQLALGAVDTSRSAAAELRSLLSRSGLTPEPETRKLLGRFGP
jgi:DNA-binding SARP family transcriptional activator